MARIKAESRMAPAHRRSIPNSNSSIASATPPPPSSIPDTPQPERSTVKMNGHSNAPIDLTSSSPLSSAPPTSVLRQQTLPTTNGTRPNGTSSRLRAPSSSHSPIPPTSPALSGIGNGDDLDMYDISHAMRSSPPVPSTKANGTSRRNGLRAPLASKHSVQDMSREFMLRRRSPNGALEAPPLDDASSSSSKRKRTPSLDPIVPVTRQDKRLRSPQPSPIKLNEDDFHPPYKPITRQEIQNWKGWVEVESEPTYINTMLRELGVKGVRAEEILDLSESVLALEPPVYGLIFLFQYQETDHVTEAQGGGCPNNVWFANQLPATNACATIALINILMNARDVELGKPFQYFKEDTGDLTPMERAHCINEHEFIRGVHNSFASRVDMWLADRIFAAKYKKAILAKEKRIRDEEREKVRAEQAARAAEEALLNPQKPKPEPVTNGRPKRRTNGAQKRKNKNKYCEDTESDDDKPPTSPTEDMKYDDESGFHYVAYVPIDGRIWRLDGMSASPQDIGGYEEVDSWLFHAAGHIQQRMEEFMSQGAGVYFNLMALVKDPATRAREQLVDNIRELRAIEQELDKLSPDWRGFADELGDDVVRGENEEFNITANTLSASHKTSTVDFSKYELEKLLIKRTDAAKDQESLKSIVRVQKVKEANEQLKVEKDRMDLNPMIHQMLLDLEENGVVHELMDEYREW